MVRNVIGDPNQSYNEFEHIHSFDFKHQSWYVNDIIWRDPFSEVLFQDVMFPTRPKFLNMEF